MLQAFALNVLYLGLTLATFLLLLQSARHKGAILTMGE
jgi:ABC-2 type transport system permease protein